MLEEVEFSIFAWKGELGRDVAGARDDAPTPELNLNMAVEHFWLDLIDSTLEIYETPMLTGE